MELRASQVRTYVLMWVWLFLCERSVVIQVPLLLLLLVCGSASFSTPHTLSGWLRCARCVEL